MQSVTFGEISEKVLDSSQADISSPYVLTPLSNEEAHTRPVKHTTKRISIAKARLRTQIDNKPRKST